MARYFGVELEFLGQGSFETTINSMQLKGMEVVNIGRYCTSNGVNWELKSDSSVSGSGYYGFELASRKLKGNEGLQELEWYAEAMNNLRDTAGFKVNRSCGVHVNIDISDFTPKNMQHFLKMMLYFEKVMYGMNPPSRTNNHYCQAIQGNEVLEKLAGMHGAIDPQAYRHLLQRTQKYSAVNLQKFLTKGLVEIRYGGGTLNPKKLLAWVSLILGIVEKAKNSQRVSVDPKATTGTMVERKDAARAMMRSLRNEGISYKLPTAHKTITKRFEKFSTDTANNVPVYGRGY